MKRVKLKETTLNHSKMVRRIEKKCQSMSIDVNTGVIIQMNMREKKELMDQIDRVLNFREQNDVEKMEMKK